MAVRLLAWASRTYLLKGRLAPQPPPAACLHVRSHGLEPHWVNEHKAFAGHLVAYSAGLPLAAMQALRRRYRLGQLRLAHVQDHRLAHCGSVALSARPDRQSGAVLGTASRAVRRYPFRPAVKPSSGWEPARRARPPCREAWTAIEVALYVAVEPEAPCAPPVRARPRPQSSCAHGRAARPHCLLGPTQSGCVADSPPAALKLWLMHSAARRWRPIPRIAAQVDLSRPCGLVRPTSGGAGSSTRRRSPKVRGICARG